MHTQPEPGGTPPTQPGGQLDAFTGAEGGQLHVPPEHSG